MEVTRIDVISGEMLTEKVEVTWRIENFDLIRNSEECLGRQTFSFVAGSKIGVLSSWSCFLKEEPSESSQTPEGTVPSKKVGYLWVKLEKVPAYVKDLMASLKLKIKTGMDSNDTIITGPSNVVQNPGWNIGNIYDWVLINGCLVLEMELTLMKLKESILRRREQSWQQIEALFKPRFSQKLQQDFAKLLDGSSDVKGDATIVSKDEIEFAVNRGILSARSTVFEKMFQTRMTEYQTGTFLMPELSSKTMTVLLRYIYTGTLHPDWRHEQVLPEIVYAAKKLGFQELVDFLDQVVGRVCTKKNAARLFSLLGKLGMKKGEGEVLNFIKRHSISFEDVASVVEEGTQEPDTKIEKWNVSQMLQSSWNMVLGISSEK